MTSAAGPTVNTQFFDKTNGIVAKIEQGLGIQP